MNPEIVPTQRDELQLYEIMQKKKEQNLRKKAGGNLEHRTFPAQGTHNLTMEEKLGNRDITSIV